MSQLAVEDLVWLRRLARSLVRDSHAADDAVQETLVRSLDRGPTGGGSLRGWLAAVLRNVVRSEGRTGARRRRREEEHVRATRSGRGSEPAALEVVEELQWHRRLVDRVHALDEPYRTAIVMRFLRERTPPEIARELGVPLKTVHSRVDRGLERMREALDRESGGDRRAWSSALASLAGDPPPILGAPVPSGSNPSPWTSSLWIPMNIKILTASLALGTLGLVAVLRTLNVEGPTNGPVVAMGESPTPPAPAKLSDVPAGVRADVAIDPASIPSDPIAVDPEPPAIDGRIRVEGRVVDLEGRSLEGIEIVFQRVVDMEFEQSLDDPTAVSDGEGRFALALDSPEGRLNLESPDWSSVSRPFLDRGVPLEEPILVAAPRRRYAGLVLGPDGVPTANAKVRISVHGNYMRAVHLEDGSPNGRAVNLRLPVGETRTDESGGFEFDSIGVFDGLFIEASRDGLAAVREALPLVSRDDFVLELGGLTVEGRALFGRVLGPEGRPRRDALVTLGMNSVRSGEDGAFALELESWEHGGWLFAALEGHLPARHPLDLSGSAVGLDPNSPIELVLGAEAKCVTGRVVDADGQPVQNAVVWTPELTHLGSVRYLEGGSSVQGPTTLEGFLGGRYGPQASRSLHTRSDGDGRFELCGLLDRPYTLFALDPVTLAAAGPETLVAGSGGGKLTLALPELRRVAGRVISKEGLPLEGVEIARGRRFDWQHEHLDRDGWKQSMMRPPGAGWTFHGEGHAVTDAEGNFSFDPMVTEGAYLFLSGTAIALGESVPLTDHTDPSDLEIRVSGAVQFRVRLDDPEEATSFSIRNRNDRVVAIYVRLENHTISSPAVDIVEGQSGTVEVPEGTYDLVLLKGEREVRRVEVELRPGATRELRP